MASSEASRQQSQAVTRRSPCSTFGAGLPFYVSLARTFYSRRGGCPPVSDRRYQSPLSHLAHVARAHRRRFAESGRLPGSRYDPRPAERQRRQLGQLSGPAMWKVVLPTLFARRVHALFRKAALALSGLIPGLLQLLASPSSTPRCCGCTTNTAAITTMWCRRRRQPPTTSSLRLSSIAIHS